MACFKVVKGAKAAVDRRVGFSGRFDLELGVENPGRLGQGRGAEAEGAPDDAGFAAGIAGNTCSLRNAGIQYVAGARSEGAVAPNPSEVRRCGRSWGARVPSFD